MALTDSQKASIRRYLGYPDINRELHRALEGAMDALSTEGEAQVGSLLTSIADLETLLASSWNRQKVIKAEEVTLTGFGEVQALRSEARRLCLDLAATLDVKPRRIPFSSGSGGSGIARRGS